MPYRYLEETYPPGHWNTELLPSKWNACPICNEKPKLWIFDNGRHAKCDCSEYSIVNATTIMEHIRKNNGSLEHYPELELRDNWNNHCEMLNRDLKLNKLLNSFNGSAK